MLSLPKLGVTVYLAPSALAVATQSGPEEVFQLAPEVGFQSGREEVFQSAREEVNLLVHVYGI